MRLSLSQAPIFSPSLQVKQEEPNYKGSVSELREIIEESRGFMEMSYAERKALNDMTGSRYLIVPRFVQDSTELMYFNLVDHVFAIPDERLFEVKLKETLSRDAGQVLASLPDISSGRFTLKPSKKGRRESFWITDSTHVEVIKVFSDRVELIFDNLVGDTGIDQGRYAAARELYLDIVNVNNNRKF